jgi:hypothetical protein
MTITTEIIRELERYPPGAYVIAALQRLLACDSHLLKVDANERSISHKLGSYLQMEFPELDVDCEYNRNGHHPKKITRFEPNTSTDDTDGRTVFPDIVVHRRGQSSNYLVIEVKKNNSRVDRSVDLEKLKAYKKNSQLRYAHALFIEFDVRGVGIARVDWV